MCMCGAVCVCDVYMCLYGSWKLLGIWKVCSKDQFQAIRLLTVLKPDANIMVWIQTVSQSSCVESLVSRHCEVTGSGGLDSISEWIHSWTPNPTALLGGSRDEQVGPGRRDQAPTGPCSGRAHLTGACSGRARLTPNPWPLLCLISWFRSIMCSPALSFPSLQPRSTGAKWSWAEFSATVSQKRSFSGISLLDEKCLIENTVHGQKKSSHWPLRLQSL